jgi:hypothetical protein
MKKLIKTTYYQLFDKLFGRYRTTMLPLSELEKNLLNLKSQGYLFDEGWVLSFQKKEVVDAAGNPKPWLTFTATQFLKEKLNNTLELFEYGGGNSTLFWAGLCKHVTTVEHDREWYESLLIKKPGNVQIYFQELKYDGDYCRYPNSLNKKFDVVIVDGRDRLNCCKASVACLSDVGIIVLDDSLRDNYQEAFTHLAALGFKWINFWGMEAFYTHRTCTTVFYKEKNCLHI